MSFGGGYNGGRTRMGTKVILNVYDLTPANEYLFPVGFGLNHSGVEILGSEYSFASGGGIFESTPKEAEGARLRESIEMGSFEGGSSELRMVIDDLRSDFGPDQYNLITKNCNHFANALVHALLKRQIPPYVNRLADLGNCCSCLLPKQMLEAAPVGPTGSGSQGGFQIQGGGGRRFGKEKVGSSQPSFIGTGSKLGSTTASSSSSEGGGIATVRGVFSSTNSSPSTRADDLTDRRERARKAALARFEKADGNTDASS